MLLLNLAEESRMDVEIGSRKFEIGSSERHD
jgi:hypothetical protein